MVLLTDFKKPRYFLKSSFNTDDVKSMYFQKPKYGFKKISVLFDIYDSKNRMLALTSDPLVLKNNTWSFKE